MRLSAIRCAALGECSILGVVRAVVGALFVAMERALGMHDDIRVSITGSALALVIILVMGALGKPPER